MHARAHTRERALSGWGHAYSRFHTSLAPQELPSYQGVCVPCADSGQP